MLEKSDKLCCKATRLIETLPDSTVTIHLKLRFLIKTMFVSSVPDEVLLKIFKYLSPSELLVCAQVCHKWSTVARDRYNIVAFHDSSFSI